MDMVSKEPKNFFLQTTFLRAGLFSQLETVKFAKKCNVREDFAQLKGDIKNHVSATFSLTRASFDRPNFT